MFSFVYGKMPIIFIIIMLSCRKSKGDNLLKRLIYFMQTIIWLGNNARDTCCWNIYVKLVFDHVTVTLFAVIFTVKLPLVAAWFAATI